MKVSVLINNYNNGLYLAACIESVLNQTYEAVEVIVYDDGSTDHSRDIIRTYDGRIQFLFDQNYGKTPRENQYHAIVEAFKQSSGEIVFLLDGDDTFHPNKVQTVVQQFMRSSELVMVQHVLEEINGNGDLIERVRPLLKSVKDYKAFVYESGSILNLFAPTSALAFRRDLLANVLPVIEGETCELVWTDLRVPYYAIFRGGIKTLSESLGQYRMHQSNDSSKLSNNHTYDHFLEQCFEYFNVVAIAEGMPTIQMSVPSILGTSIFITDLLCSSFLDEIDLDKNIYIWGAGEAGRALHQYLLEEISSGIAGFIDSNPAKQGESVDELQIYSTDVLSDKENVQVIVSAFYAMSALKTKLLTDFGLKENQIIIPFKEGVNN